MNKRELNYLEMYKTVDSLFINQPEIWSGFTPLVPVFSNFKMLLDKLQKESMVQHRSATRGHTAHKNAQKDELATLAYALAVKMKAFAKVTKDMVLQDSVDFSFTDIRRSPEEKFITNCQTIYDLAATNLSNLAAYNVSETDLANLDTGIKNYVPLASARNTIGDAGVIATGTLVELFALINEELDKLDDIVEALIGDVTFRRTYLEARKITDRRGPGARTTDEVEVEG